MLSPLLFAVALAPTTQESEAFQTRFLIPKEPLIAHELPAQAGPQLVERDAQHRLIVKFLDAAKARAMDDGDLNSTSLIDLSPARDLAESESLRFDRAIRIDEQKLAALEARAAANSGRTQPDLAGILEVVVPSDDPRELERIGEAFNKMAIVEFAYIQTLGVQPPEDLSPPTPDFESQQRYLGPNPGIDADYAKSQGLTGNGIRFSDCEYGWDAEHEDLRDMAITLEAGQTIHPEVYTRSWDDHGTAVLGETSSVHNAYGTSGMMPGADAFIYPEWTLEGGFRRLTAITNAIADSSAGDIVLLEMQTVGAGGDYGPAELDPGVWLAVRAGTDAGVIVVGAAGNGNQDLDSAAYQSYRDRGDSNAIIVGAGSANSAHYKLSFSTYGARVNVQGWGQGVFTLGYGDFLVLGGDDRQTYTNSFGGTSSASPFIASACGLLQELSFNTSGSPLSPTALRDLLINTGIPQGAGGHIGPFVYLRAAIDNLSGNGPRADECAGAVSLLDGVSQSYDTSSATSSTPAWPCVGNGGSDIWYSYTTALAGSDVTVTTCGSSYDTVVQIFSGSCGSLTSLACNDDACARQSTATATNLPSGTSLLIRVGGRNGLSGSGTVLLTESGGAPGCGSLPDDSFEDNDDCPGAAALSDGFYPGLAVFEADNDFFAVAVDAGSTLDASIVFSNASGDLDLYLWDPLVVCDTSIAGLGTGSGALAAGFSASDGEFISYTNTTGASQNLILEVDMFGAGGCNNYDMIVTGSGVSAGPIGSNYCAANANSTGSPGAMSAFGFTSVAANDVTLTASNLPSGQFGIFVTSSVAGFVLNPAGSNGNLCLDGSLGRFVGPGQILQIDSTGEASLAIDLTAIPSGAGTVAVVAGDTRYFQAWHRDVVGGGSNFTDGLRIFFTN